MDLPQSLISRIDILSYPCALSTFTLFAIKFISSSVKVFLTFLLVLNCMEGTRHLLITGAHGEAKHELKSSAFSAKFGTTSPSTRIGGILGIFLLLKNRFKIE